MSSRNSGSRVLLIVCWLVVVIPAGWGVIQTVERSLDLFSARPAVSNSR